MTDSGVAREWDVVVPENDAELIANFRHHGVRPVLRLHVSVIDDSEDKEELPAFIGSFRSGQPDLAERSSEILNSEFPNQ